MIRAQFRVNIPQVRSGLKAHVLQVQKKIAFDLLQGIVMMTPKDTGRATGNWFATLTAPRVDYDWDKYDLAGGGTVSAGNSIIQAIQDYGAIYLTNNLPYILALEKGHSKQAPAGMVQVSLDRVTAGLR